MFDWDPFCVFHCDGLLPQKSRWLKKANWLPVETCARHIYAGRQSSLNDVPSAILSDPGTRKVTGMDAYVFLMNFCAGLLKDNGTFDENAVGQLRTSWNKYMKNYPEPFKDIAPFIEKIFHDAALIQTGLNPFQRNPSVANVAIQNAALNPQKSALLFCEERDISVQMICSMGTKRSVNPGQIILTHFREDGLLDVLGGLLSLKYDKAITASLGYVSIDEALSKTIHSVDAAVMCHHMDDHPEDPLPKNRIIAHAWERRLSMPDSQPATLFHVRGLRAKAGACFGEVPAPWRNFSKDSGFISFFDIQNLTRKSANERQFIAEQARQAVSAFADYRLHGLRPFSFSVDSKTLQASWCHAPLKSSLVRVARQTPSCTP